MTQMTVGAAIQVDDYLRRIIVMLNNVIEIAAQTEALWDEAGDGIVADIWTAQQKQQFTDLLQHTEDRQTALRARLIEAAQ